MKAKDQKHRRYFEKISEVTGDLAKTYGIAMLAVFGSLVKGNFRKNSDIDLLIRFNDPVGMITFIRLEDTLRKKLGRKVDLVTENALSPYFRRDVLRNMKVVYGEK